MTEQDIEYLSEVRKRIRRQRVQDVIVVLLIAVTSAAVITLVMFRLALVLAMWK